MNLNKHSSFFDPLNQIKGAIHIIGCGAVGSTIAEMLTRMGVPELHIYDYDTVSAHNISNQMFFDHQVGMEKTAALTSILKFINPLISIQTHGKYDNQKLSGYVFLCVDSIETRHAIATAQAYNPYIKAMFDFRMRLTDAQHYAADWKSPEHKKRFIGTMNFTSAEAKEATPVNACGTHLNIVPTVRVICSLGLANFINFVKEGKLKHLILADSFHFIFDIF